MDLRIIVFGRNINTAGANFTGFLFTGANNVHCAGCVCVCVCTRRIVIMIMRPGRTFGWAPYYIKRRRGDGIWCVAAVSTCNKRLQNVGARVPALGVYIIRSCMYIHYTSPVCLYKPRKTASVTISNSHDSHVVYWVYTIDIIYV